MRPRELACGGHRPDVITTFRCRVLRRVVLGHGGATRGGYGRFAGPGNALKKAEVRSDSALTDSCAVGRLSPLIRLPRLRRSGGGRPWLGTQAGGVARVSRAVARALTS